MRGLDVDEIAFATTDDAVGAEMAVFFDRRVGLRNDKGFLTVGGQVIEMATHFAMLDFAVRSFQEAKIVNAGERCQRSDQADVRSFGCFHRANTAIVRRMHVAHFEAGAIA